jgi:hypothetical protein
MLRKLIYAALIAGAIGGAYAYSEWTRGHKSSATKKPDILITAMDLATQYSDATHPGKIIEVTGKVAAVEVADTIINITLKTTDPMTAVTCEMEKGSPTPTCKEGDEVTLRGQCDGKISDVNLSRCVVIK